MLTNLTPLHYDRGTIVLALAMVAAVSVATLALPGQRRRLADLWRSEKRLVLVSEVLFLAFFLSGLAHPLGQSGSVARLEGRRETDGFRLSECRHQKHRVSRPTIPGLPVAFSTTTTLAK